MDNEDIEITEGTIYNSIIRIELRSWYSLRSVRGMFNERTTEEDKTFQIDLKLFLKKMVRTDWTKIRQADRYMWWSLIDIVIDNADNRDIVKFVVDEWSVIKGVEIDD